MKTKHHHHGSDELVRFGVAIGRQLLEKFDDSVDARRSTRSEVLRDLIRAELARQRLGKTVPVVASLTLIYDHHVRELSERLVEIQHALGQRVQSTMHVHLDHHYCMEVLILKGQAKEIQSATDRLLATRGVEQGGVVIVPDPTRASSPKARVRSKSGER